MGSHFQTGSDIDYVFLSHLPDTSLIEELLQAVLDEARLLYLCRASASQDQSLGLNILHAEVDTFSIGSHKISHVRGIATTISVESSIRGERGLNG